MPVKKKAKRKPAPRHSKKVGLPPGTLVYVGEKKVESVRITLLDYDEQRFEEKQVARIEECFPFRQTPTVTWVNIDGLHEVDTIDRLVGLFAADQMPAAGGRSPTLPEMTAAALEVLNGDPDGFFLMVEGSQPDWRGHENAPLDGLVAEMLDFDDAIRVGDRTQPVCNHEARAITHEIDEAGLYQPLALRVQIARGFVQDKDPRVGQYGSSDCQSLTLATT